MAFATLVRRDLWKSKIL